MTDSIGNRLGVDLRLALGQDVDRVRAILAAAASDLTARFGEGHWSTAPSLEALRRYVDEGALYVARLGTVAVGTLRLSNRKIGFYRSDWFTNPQDDAAYVLDMAVDPAHQRCGIGHRSMAIAEDLARTQELKAIRLDAYGGPAGAGGFYRKCGYSLVHEGEMRGVALEYYEKLL
jgi:GNAT superfamily N-acetyltransferase